ncbi:MAG: circadian clock protein KaiC [Methanoregula sp. PtaU1.Bin051]|nr:MAG: circadian clock protein KaiC [Methanoregula sp. PtaU1.Bin051]
MVSQAIRRIPTGISSLDPILDGGVPPGSVILLLGEIGSGSYEFVYSSIVNLLAGSRYPAADTASVILPAQIHYITFTRMKDDIMQEMAKSFPSADINAVTEKMRFDDLSEIYFDNSVVPDEWYSQGDIITRLQKRADHPGILSQLARAINAAEENGLVVIDALTDIATQCRSANHWKNFASLLRGLQRMAKQRNLTIYLLLTRGIIEGIQEHEIADIVDAVLLFRWEEAAGARRQRVMYFEKFRGVMPYLEERDLVKFAVRISTSEGFEVSNIRVVI